MTPSKLVRQDLDVMTKAEIEREVSKLVKAYGNTHRNAEKYMERCAKIYATAVDIGFGADEAIRKANPGTPSDVWRKLNLYGRGEMNIRLMTPQTGSRIAQLRNTLEKLSIEDQNRIIDGTVPFVVTEGNVKDANIKDVNASQLKQLAGGGFIRTVEEQKQYLADKAEAIPNTRRSPGVSGPSYEIRKGEVVTNAKSKLTKKDVKVLVKELLTVKEVEALLRAMKKEK